MKTTLDIALIRWSVACSEWGDFAAGHRPVLGAFLAGWFARDMGIAIQSAKDCQFRDSFRKGWSECDQQIAIIDQSTPPMPESL